MIVHCMDNILRLAKHGLERYFFSVIMNKLVVGRAMKIRENVGLINIILVETYLDINEVRNKGAQLVIF